MRARGFEPGRFEPNRRLRSRDFAPAGIGTAWRAPWFARAAPPRPRGFVRQ